MQRKTIIFLGPQGSGKGTQLEKVRDYFHSVTPEQPVVTLETGKAFRALKTEDSYYANSITELIEAGKLVPDFITDALVLSDLRAKLTETAHLLLDGFPRNVNQANFLDKVLAFYQRMNIDVVYLNTPEEVVRARMMGRGRSDDTEEGINERLRLYKEQTEPLLEFYRTRPQTNFIEIIGSDGIEDIFTSLITRLV